jgi:hypothetical protein
MTPAPSWIRTPLFLALSLLVMAAGVAQQGAPAKRAVPLEPTDAILDAFGSHAIVALPEGATHGDLQGHAFRLSLVRAPRFATVVNDIIVEWGNARYQDVMDRFVQGQDVPYNTLRQVWQNTTIAGPTWDAPIYEEFFRAVRAVNASLPAARQVRVLLGDPPIDWDRVQSAADVLGFGANRDGHPAELIQREVIAKQRRALVIYGSGHLLRRSPANIGPEAAPRLLVRRLEDRGAKVFTIAMSEAGDMRTVQAEVAAWRIPSLAIVRGTVLGQAKFRFYAPAPSVFREIDSLRDLSMEDQYDAVLYFGPPSPIRIAQLAPALCADADYMNMRIWRMTLMNAPVPQTGASQADRLKAYCASVAPK